MALFIALLGLLGPSLCSVLTTPTDLQYCSFWPAVITCTFSAPGSRVIAHPPKAIKSHPDTDNLAPTFTRFLLRVQGLAGAAVVWLSSLITSVHNSHDHASNCDEAAYQELPVAHPERKKFSPCSNRPRPDEIFEGFATKDDIQRRLAKLASQPLPQVVEHDVPNVSS